LFLPSFINTLPSSPFSQILRAAREGDWGKGDYL
jgi:hypothetical protein